MQERYISALLIVLILLLSISIILLVNQNHWLSEIIRYESPIKIGQRAYLFETRSVKDEPVNITSGNAILYFFKLNCDACQESFPAIIKNYSKFKTDGLQVIGISADNKIELIKFIDQNQIQFPIIADPKQQIFTKYRIHFVPLVVMVDSQNRICFYQKSNQSLEDVIFELDQCCKVENNLRNH